MPTRPSVSRRTWGGGQGRTTGLSRCDVFGSGKAEGKCLHGNCAMRRGSLRLVRYMEESSQVRPPSLSHKYIHRVIQAVPWHVSRVLVHTCSGCTRLQPPFPSAPVGSSCIASQRPPCQSPPGLATPALCNETGNLDGGTLGSFPIIASGSASVGNTTGYHWQLGTSWEPPVLLGSACLGFPSAVPFLHFWPFDHSCPPLFFFPFPSAWVRGYSRAWI